MRIYVYVALGGALGALGRYQVWLSLREGITVFPWSILIINVTGSFILGFCSEWKPFLQRVSPELRTGLTSGFVGAYTTFSTFAVESLQLLQDGQIAACMAYVLLSIVFGWACVGWGMRVGARFQ